MIKTAYLAVLLIAGLLAFGLFALVRGTGGDAGGIAGVANGPTAPAPVTLSETAKADDVSQKFYFLQELAQSGLLPDDPATALILFGASADGVPLVLRDAAALMAAQTSAVVTYSSGSMTVTQAPAPAASIFAQIFRDDRFIASITCPGTTCADLLASGGVDYAGLLQTAIPAQRVQDSFDTHEAYLATIEAIAADPDFMLLDARPASGFPSPRMVPSLALALPTVVTSAQSPLDLTLHGTLVAEAARGALPEGAAITDVAVTPLPSALLGDSDNSKPLLLGGAPVAFDGAGFYAVDLTIEGIAALDAAALSTLTAATTLRYDYTADFDAFVAARVQTDCDDCLVAVLPDKYTAYATVTQSTAALYTLSYYDLREAP